MIRWLYHRPLEALLATFRLILPSHLQQNLPQEIFGRAGPAPDAARRWRGQVSIKRVRVSIRFDPASLSSCFGVIFLRAHLALILNRTRLGSSVGAVTANSGRGRLELGVIPPGSTC